MRSLKQKCICALVLVVLTVICASDVVAREVVLELVKTGQDYYNNHNAQDSTRNGEKVTYLGSDWANDAWAKYRFHMTEWKPWITKIEVLVKHGTYETEGAKPRMQVWDDDADTYRTWEELPEVGGNTPQWASDYSTNSKYREDYNNDYITTVKLHSPVTNASVDRPFCRTYIYAVKLRVYLDYTWSHGTIDNTRVIEGGPKVIDFGEVDLGRDYSQNATIKNIGYGSATRDWQTSGISWINSASGSIDPREEDTIIVTLDSSDVNSGNISELEGKLLSIGGARDGLTGDFYYIPESDLTDLDQAFNHGNKHWSFSYGYGQIRFHEGDDISNAWEEDEWFKPSYSSGSAITKHHFVAHFTGFIEIDTTGTHKFYVTSDDGFRLKIDGQTVTEYLGDRSAATSQGTITLDKGFYPIELQYFQSTGGKCITLEWDPPGDNTSRVPVPSGNLYSGYYMLVRATPKKPTVQFTNQKGSNNMVNVPTQSLAEFTVNATPGSTGVDIDRYRWQRKSGTDAPGAGYEDNTENSYSFSFDNPGEYTVYCQVVDEKGVESDWASIRVRAWNRPVVKESPPQSHVDAGDVSWFSDKYVGVVGQPVRLKGDAETATTGQGESIAKYFWYLNNEWVEASTSEIVSQTWDNASTNDQVKCKAETSFGIQSDEQSFPLRVYGRLEVDSGAPYTGRPNQTVDLEGAANTNAYPGATFVYQWRVDGSDPVGDTVGVALHEGDYIELTPAQDGKNGQFDYVNYDPSDPDHADLILKDDWSVTGEFWTGGGTGADAFYVYVWAAGPPDGETADRDQYAIVFDEYNEQIQFYDGEQGTVLQHVDQPIPLDNSQWRPFRITFLEGTFEVYLDHQLKMTQEVTNYQTRMNNALNKDNPANNHFGFGARTGGQNNIHRVRDMKWTTGEAVYTDNGGRAEHSWDADGTYLVGFTTRVETTEGLEIEDTAVAEVTIEAGKPTAMPGGPYRGGIAGGSYSPIPFEGNHPDFVESDDVGHIERWTWLFEDGGNGALQLDGRDDHVMVNPVASFPTDAFTVELWMKTSDDARKGCPISYASSATHNDFLMYDYRNFHFEVASERVPNPGKSGISVNDGQWHHLAVTWQSSDGDFRVYKDGVLEFSGTVAQGVALTGGGAFVIGQEQDSVGGSFDRDQAFEGTIDEVRVWDVVRPPEAIRSDMGRKLTGGESGLLAYYTFEEGGGTETVDISGNGNDAQLHTTDDGDPEAPSNRWIDNGRPEVVLDRWDPSHGFPNKGDYQIALKVGSEYGKWSYIATTDVTVVDGKIAGYVRAADLRTPVREVQLTLTSSHVDPDVLGQIADANVEDDPNLETVEGGGLKTLTDDKGYYEFTHIPLGSYRIRANKGEGDSAHEFEKSVQATELTLDGPNQLAIDFVDLSVFPVGGRIAYSLQKNGEDVYVPDVTVTAQPVGSTSAIEALTSTSTLSSGTKTNYSLPLFAGKYLFLPKLEGHDIRINEDVPGYDGETGLVTIEEARSNVDFTDHTTHTLIVLVEDSGGYAITTYQGNPVTVTVSGDHGQVSDMEVDEDGMVEVEMNPGTYTVTVPGSVTDDDDDKEDVDLLNSNQTLTMTIPVQIEVAFDPRPKLFDAPDEFLAEFGLDPSDNPEGYLYYYPPQPRTHTYTISATANGQPVEDFTLIVTDEVSLMTDDDPEEQNIAVTGDEAEYVVLGGLPKLDWDVPDGEPPLAGVKTISFKVIKDGYEDSEPVRDEVTVLGDVLKGTEPQIVAVPVVNYTVLHDPPGDGSYSYLDDTVKIKGFIRDMQIRVLENHGGKGPGKPGENRGETIKVYPSPWSSERTIEDFDFGKTPNNVDPEDDDLLDYGILDYEPTEDMAGVFVGGVALEVGTGLLSTFVPGPWAIPFILAKIAIAGAKFGTGDAIAPGVDMVQYEVSANRRLQTPGGGSIPDLIGPGKGDLYFGEGWTLGLQEKYRLGIQCTGEDNDGNCLGWERTTEDVMTYDILSRTNQYVYTTQDIENIIDDLQQTIDDPDTRDDERTKLTDAQDTWQDLLDRNRSYVWDREYVTNGKTFEDYKREQDYNSSGETLIFSGGPSFEYSRRIYEGDLSTYSVNSGFGTSTSVNGQLVFSVGSWAFGSGVLKLTGFESEVHVATDHIMTQQWEGGEEAEQIVGFVLQDDDFGDNIATRVFTDGRWGTPIFFQDGGSYTSDPWEPGTNKAVDVTLDWVEQPTGTFDYHEGAHGTVKVTYVGERRYGGETDQDGNVLQTIDFALYAPQPSNADNLTVRFNGTHEPYIVRLNHDLKSAVIGLSLYPPEKDRSNFGEKSYGVQILAQEVVDAQIASPRSLTVAFADLRAPRATLSTPYPGQRISPVFFPDDTPFKILVVSEDTDLKRIQLERRSKQPDGVWGPWEIMTGMLWEDGGTNENVTVFDRMDSRPPRREFTFKWAGDNMPGVGEYSIRAVATDKATDANVDIDPPPVEIVIDNADPTVLTTLPDYQARESQRIYRGELSVTFTDDMRADDFDDRTFYVMDLLSNNEQVAGYVSYSQALRKAVFVPQTPFQPNGYYRVEVKTDEDTDGNGSVDTRGVHDLAGNPLDSAFMWTFRTTDAPFEETWSLNWRVTDGTMTSANNIAAVEYGAEDGEDEKDVRAVPALASQMRLDFLNRNEQEFDRDIRPADGRLAHHWFMVVDNATNGATVTLEYQPSSKLTKTTRQYQVLRLVEFDQDGNVSNTISLDPTQAETDPDTGIISYVQAYQYENQGERSRYFRLDVQKASYVAQEVEKGTSGWKFLSVPIEPQRAEPFVNLGDDIDPFQLFQYDTALSGYKIYPYDIGEVGLQTGHGYFTRLPGDVNVDVGGSSNQSDVTLELADTGWHPIGNPFIKEVAVSSLEINGMLFDAAVDAGIVEGTLYLWEIVTEEEQYTSSVPISDSYQSVTSGDSIDPWDGYWFKTNQSDVTLVIPVPPGLPNQAPTPEYLKPPMAPASVSTLARLQVDTLGEGAFRLPLKLTSNLASDLTTTLGVHSQASLGKDRFDQSEPPTLSKTVALYFHHSDWEGDTGQYNHDFQPVMNAGESRVWQLTAYTDESDTTMTVSWEDAIADVPEDVMLWIGVQGSGNRDQVSPERQSPTPSPWLNMRKTTSLELASQGRITEIPLEIRAERFALISPQDVQVVAGEQQVTVRWRGESEFVDRYMVERVETRGQGDKETRRFEYSPPHPVSLSPHHEFVDDDVVEEQIYTYQVTAHYITGAKLSSELFTVTVLPFIKETVLLPAYPNPFNPDTWIPYELEQSAEINIDIYDMHGRRVRQLVLGEQPRGRYTSRAKAAHWDGSTYTGERAASGIYFVVLKAGDHFTATRKLVIRK